MNCQFVLDVGWETGSQQGPQGVSTTKNTKMLVDMCVFCLFRSD